MRGLFCSDLVKICLLGGCSLFASTPARAQLEITEVMFNPIAANDSAWEWIEVRNNGGAPVDLLGAYSARLGSAEVSGPAIDGSATNTVIPAGGVAVIYDANLGAGNTSSFNDQLFRDAWGLGIEVPLIGAALLPPLSNAGTNVAFWANQSDYVANLELNPESNVFEVTSLNDALFSLDYTAGAGFPASTNGTSMRWGGNGDYQVGSNWALTQVGETGVVSSLPVSVIGNTNSPADIANPGVVPAGATAEGLLISEIMYNPRSTEDPWEWVEIYNNTGSTVDFAATPYIFDDDDQGPLTEENVTSGTVANGSAAILYNADDLNFLDVQGAWDPSGTNGTNFIPVTSWPALSNSGDLVALWDNFANYTSDEAAGNTANATSVVNYDDNPVDATDPWPQDDGNGSIFLSDLTADPAVGASWSLSNASDGFSFNAVGLSGSVEIHPGGDLGSPGTSESASGDPADLNGDGLIDGLDLGILLGNFNQTGIPASGGELNGSDPVDGLDLGILLGSWSPPAASGAVAAVPEPASIGLIGLALATAALGRRWCA